VEWEWTHTPGIRGRVRLLGGTGEGFILSEFLICERSASGVKKDGGRTRGVVCDLLVIFLTMPCPSRLLKAKKRTKPMSVQAQVQKE
jgi:hypothetical protein